CLTLFGYGMTTGGPAVIVWGWPLVGLMTLFVGLAMAEICSSYPTAGGLYFWAAKLAPSHPAAWAWFTGWFNFRHRIDPHTRTPTNAVWLAAAGAFLLGLPYLWNATAYAAVTSIAVIGLYTAYVLPTWLRLLRGRDFEPGPWHLGRWSRPVGIVAIAWTAFVSVLFMLPTTYPVTFETFNYTPVAVLAVIGFAGGWWLVSARFWFTGPRVQGTPEEIAAIERELAEIGGPAPR
ncbi:MAG: hypothetical protein RL698_946, partial [Pseudomonadota bacterium]